MAKKSTLYYIYADLVNALKNVIEPKYLFLQDRPNASDFNLPMSKFAVIDLPANINDYVIGGRKTLLTTNGVFYLFTQSKKNQTLDVNAVGNFVDAVVELFPIKGECCKATNPSVLMRGSDGLGFQVTTIAFDLQCRWGVFERKNNE